MLHGLHKVQKSSQTVAVQYTTLLLLIHGSSAFKSRVRNRRAYLKFFFLSSVDAGNFPYILSN